MPADVRFGVIGLTRGLSFLRLCEVVGGARVTALHDTDAARGREVAARAGARYAPSMDALLAEDVDAVVVASPVPYHAQHAVRALAAGKHVLSEVIACTSLEEARALVDAARASDAVYMLGENYRYLDEVELTRRLYADGRFGEVYYAEAEYLHDCRDLWYADDGALTWRADGRIGVYCTHSVGPLLYVTDDRVTSVSATTVPGGRFDPRVTAPSMHLLHLCTDAGRVFRVRVDHTSPRPHQMAYYALQGSAGSYESWRGNGDTSKVWLDDAHERSGCEEGARWHDLGAFAERYIPERLAAPPEATVSDHGTSEYWMLPEFLEAVRGERAAPIDVHRGLDYTLPGILAAESVAAGGAAVEVPDSREW
ncbi:Gfo/Idh/MocA family oxidoreductase [Streptomyces sp. AJS327]|uniref:Gfo/Idh/MocA family protein n=1 Tax=Streptomyces sp. AJS327 TaxID=2545265 RepID=UPI0015DE1264|nr:Gfo/Idh/MocA family oxidoreductase [Streptomyces sp. AJS327]MBA0052026.1 Gfo/Idh/MocA family oxidoreductase [Streptomyces sp. AJS327]